MVPNKFPAFTGQEVVVHGPRHAVRISDIAEGVLEVAISVWGERRRAHAAAGAVYVLTGINEGAGAGASLDHSHSQIVPFAEPPPVVLAEAEAFDSAPCPLCESGGATRHLIRHADGLQTFAPHWARTPYETWIAPDAHLSEVAGADSLAAALRDLSRRLRALLGDDLSWNAILHEAPPAATVGAWHWHMEVMPRLTVPALTEYGAGIWVNVIEPARAAQDLAIALP